MVNSELKEKLVSGIMLLFSIIYLFGCFELKIGSLDNPGPGFVPALIGILLIICTFVYFLQAIKLKICLAKRKDTKLLDKRETLVVLVFSGVILAFPLLLKIFNFLISTSLIVFIMLSVMRYRNTVYRIIISLAFSLISFALFSKLLGIYLPSGQLELLIF